MIHKTIFNSTLIVLLAVLLLIIVLWGASISDNIKYWLFYFPAYKVFGGGLYFCFYLQIAKWGLVAAFVSLMLYWAWKAQDEKKPKEKKPFYAHTGMVLLCVLAIFAIYMGISNLTTGMKEISNEAYQETIVEVGTDAKKGEAKLKRLKRRRSSGRHGSVYYELGDYTLDVYQYFQLKKILEPTPEKDIDMTVDEYLQLTANTSGYNEMSASRQQSIKQQCEKLWENKSSKQHMLQLLPHSNNTKKTKITYMPKSKRVLSYEAVENM